MTENDLENKDEITFPLQFDACPNCGSKKRVAETVGNEEKAKGRIGKDMDVVTIQFQSVVCDPRRIVLASPVLFSYMDICAECGLFYCTKVQKHTATPQVQQPGSSGPLTPKGHG